MSEQSKAVDVSGSSEPVVDLAAELGRTNGELRDSVRRVEAIIQSIGDGVIVADEYGRLQLFNRAAEELVGVGLTNTLPDDWPTTYGVFLADGKTHCPANHLPLTRAICGEEVDGAELLVRNPARQDLIPIRVRGRPIRDEQGQLRGGVVVFHDITEQKQAEASILRARDELEQRVAERTAKLKESEARYQDLYENAPDMFLSVSLATSQVTQCNNKLLAATGFAASDVIGHTVYRLFHESCVAAMKRALRTLLTAGEVSDVDLLLRHSDGSTVDVSLNVAAIRDPSGRITHSRSVMRDITDRKNAEEQIRRQQDELTHVARLSAMGEMAAGLAHEINQPLTAIAAYAEGGGLRARRGHATVEELSEIFDRIAADAHRAGEIIRRLRRFVQKREVDRGFLDVNETIREVCRFVGAEASQQNATLQLELADNLPRVPADSVEIQQVILNLVSNALDAMRDANSHNRRVLIESRRTKEQGVEVIVQDTGPGISAELRDQAFQQFFTSKQGGLGIGLSISQSIIESHKGAIWFASPAGSGARVQFRLPPGKFRANHV